jgi:hypothetical protein
MYRYPITIPVYRGLVGDDEGIHRRFDYYKFEVRTITRREFRNWRLAYDNPYELEDRILAETVLAHPEAYDGRAWQWDEIPFGIPQRLLEEILSLSGFSEQGVHPLIMERVQDYLANDEAKYDQLIMLATDAYKITDLQDMEPEDYHALVGQAQWKLSLIGFDPDIILDPQGYQVKAKKARAQARAEAEVGARNINNRSRGRGQQNHVETTGEMSVVAGEQVQMPASFVNGSY